MRQRRRPVTALVALVAFALSFGLPFMAPRHAWVDDPDSGWVGLPPIGAGGAYPFKRILPGIAADR